MQRCVQRTRKDETTQRNKTDAEFRKIRHVFDDTLDGCSGEAGAIATPGELDTMRAGWFDGLFGCFRPVLWSLAAKTTGKTDDWEVTYLVSIIWTRYETLDSSNWWTFTLFMDEVTKTSFIQKQIISINCVKTWICLKRMSEKDVTEVLLFQQYFKNNFLRCLPRLKSFFLFVTKVPFDTIRDLEWLGSGAQGAVFKGYVGQQVIAVKKVLSQNTHSMFVIILWHDGFRTISSGLNLVIDPFAWIIALVLCKRWKTRRRPTSDTCVSSVTPMSFASGKLIFRDFAQKKKLLPRSQGFFKANLKAERRHMQYIFLIKIKLRFRYALNLEKISPLIEY